MFAEKIVSLNNDLCNNKSTRFDDIVKQSEQAISIAKASRKRLISINQDLENDIKRKNLKIEQVSNLRDKLIQKKLKNINDISDHNTEISKQCLNMQKFKREMKYFEFCKKIINCRPEESGFWFFEDKECSVCFEEKLLAKLQCSHYICKDTCLITLLKNSKFNCPICRHKMISYEYYDETILQVVNDIIQREPIVSLPRVPIFPFERRPSDDADSDSNALQTVEIDSDDDILENEES